MDKMLVEILPQQRIRAEQRRRFKSFVANPHVMHKEISFLPTGNSWRNSFFVIAKISDRKV
ncbi:MAG: hypothetical protein LBE11_06355 [Prevotellaceae bacterium]|jgi:hypothetical protein|nr:hypothetical protein [Prevotellaceae bacterium]